MRERSRGSRTRLRSAPVRVKRGRAPVTVSAAGTSSRAVAPFPLDPLTTSLAVFLSEVFPHEVLPTTEERYSLAGWFRPRAELPLENV